MINLIGFLMDLKVKLNLLGGDGEISLVEVGKEVL